MAKKSRAGPPRHRIGAAEGAGMAGGLHPYNRGPLPPDAEPPMSEEDIRRYAELWIDRLGDSALRAARAMERTLEARGDRVHADEWRRISAEIEERRRRRSAPDAPGADSSA